MKEKADTTIHLRVPNELKEELKKQFGYNLSKTTKETFLKMIDRKNKERKCICFICKEPKSFSEVYLGFLEDGETKLNHVIVCKDCYNQYMDTLEKAREFSLKRYKDETAGAILYYMLQNMFEKMKTNFDFKDFEEYNEACFEIFENYSSAFKIGKGWLEQDTQKLMELIE